MGGVGGERARGERKDTAGDDHWVHGRLIIPYSMRNPVSQAPRPDLTRRPVLLSQKYACEW
jgi:hypothetical protein